MKKLLNPSVILGAARVLGISAFLAVAGYTVYMFIIHPNL
jgi:hypothetical protein